MADTSTSSFEWTGIDSRGKRVHGVIQAADKKDVPPELKKQGIEVISVKQRNQINLSLVPRK